LLAVVELLELGLVDELVLGVVELVSLELVLLGEVDDDVLLELGLVLENVESLVELLLVLGVEYVEVVPVLDGVELGLVEVEP